MTCLKILNFFWKGQVVVIKSRVAGYVFSLKFYFQVVEVLHCVSQKSNSFPLSFPKKAENALPFLHIWLNSRKKTKRQRSLQNSSLTQASFITVHK